MCLHVVWLLIISYVAIASSSDKLFVAILLMGSVITAGTVRPIDEPYEATPGTWVYPYKDQEYVDILTGQFAKSLALERYAYPSKHHCECNCDCGFNFFHCWFGSPSHKVSMTLIHQHLDGACSIALHQFAWLTWYKLNVLHIARWTVYADVFCPVWPAL